jgi:hypothetical protein
VAKIRKLLTGLHEIIEKSRMETRHKHKASERVRMEKDRMLASISVLQKENQDFFWQAGRQMYEALGEDLQHFNNYLDQPGMRAGIPACHPFQNKPANCRMRLKPSPDCGIAMQSGLSTKPPSTF